jgi:UDP-GlcNAc:undecaprenyl-phosphate/decaprenyl-phosphate GlcNAc-1-phosphate transferase
VTATQQSVGLLASFLGYLVARVVAHLRLRRPPSALMRTNVDGHPVPAILGEPLCAGALTGLGAVALIGRFEPEVSYPRLAGAAALVIGALAIAGRWDDRRGDERPRGFKGHLAAARSGRLTGGIVKLLAGGGVGLAAGAVVGSGWTIVETAALVALTANLVNLLDRAPGRAGKAALVAAIVLAIFGSTGWTLQAAGMIGALSACLSHDLRGRAMLGDAGANPLGGMLGLGLAVSLDRPGRLATIGVLVVLNALSERYSFSRAIEQTPVLRWLDLLGRKGPEANDRDP